MTNSNNATNGRIFGTALIVLCMLLRATDLFARQKTLLQFSPLQLITAEHLIGLIIFLPWFKNLSKIRVLGAKDLCYLFLVAGGASVGGILAFTSAFMYTNPALVILIQKLQPVFAISLSLILLKERPSKAFYAWSALAILSGYVLSFGWDLPEFSAPNQKHIGVMLALLAALFWGGGTVFGKHLLQKIDTATLTQYRYTFGAMTAVFLLIGSMSLGTTPPLNTATELPAYIYILYMAVVPGFAALYLYYQGLAKVSAALAAICELTYPIFAVLISWIFLNQKLSVLQLGSATVLLLATLAASRCSRQIAQ